MAPRPPHIAVIAMAGRGVVALQKIIEDPHGLAVKLGAILTKDLCPNLVDTFGIAVLSRNVGSKPSDDKVPDIFNGKLVLERLVFCVMIIGLLIGSPGFGSLLSCLAHVED